VLNTPGRVWLHAKQCVVKCTEEATKVYEIVEHSRAVMANLMQTECPNGNRKLTDVFQSANTAI